MATMRDSIEYFKQQKDNNNLDFIKSDKTEIVYYSFNTKAFRIIFKDGNKYRDDICYPQPERLKMEIDRLYNLGFYDEGRRVTRLLDFFNKYK